MTDYLRLSCADPRCVDPAAGPLHFVKVHPQLDLAEAAERARLTRVGGDWWCRRHTPTPIPSQRQGHDE